MLEQIDHVNIVVGDLESMVRFYEQVLGMKVTKRVTISGAWVERVAGLSGVQANVVYLELAPGTRLELIEYVSPKADRPVELDRPNTPGLRHLAFRVTDIEAMTARLEAAGVNMVSGIEQVPDAQVTYTGGVRKRLAYFHDPEQNLLELCEYR